MSDTYKYQKAYYRLHNNFYRALKRGILTDNDRKVMELELRKAKHIWDEAEEQNG